MRRLVVTVAAVAAWLSFGAAARADISVCNDFGATIHVALAYPNGDKFTAAGWWSVDPGKCLDVNFSFSGATLYYSADSDDYKEGGRTHRYHWGNQKKLYVSAKKFDTDEAERHRRGSQGQMFSSLQLTDQQQGKPLQITLHFQEGSTSINVKIK